MSAGADAQPFATIYKVPSDKPSQPSQKTARQPPNV